jgi:hypothetical protein
LLRKVRHTGDGRVRRLYLTARGKRLSRQASRGTIEDYVRRVLRRHPDEHLAAASRLVSDLADQLNRT